MGKRSLPAAGKRPLLRLRPHRQTPPPPPLTLTKSSAILSRSLRQILLPGLPVVFRPPFPHSFMIVRRHSHVHEVYLRAGSYSTEREDQDRPILFLPMCRSPKLNDFPT